MNIIIFKNCLLAAFARTDLKNLKFQVKTDETELIGIDLKSVSLKRQIKNDAQTEVISLMNLNQLRNFIIAPVEESKQYIASCNLQLTQKVSLTFL